MRRLALIAPLLVSACMRAPVPAVEAPKPVEQPRAERGYLVGLSVDEIGERFGKPDLTFKEGPGTKLQYRSAGCVLDAYLYAPESGRGVARVTHVDTRDRQGRDIDRAGCEAEIEASR